MSNNEEFGFNIGKEMIQVKHSDLKRFGDSPFRSVCPVCKEGILPVRRDPVTFNLQRLDTCLLCGQAIQYIDKPWNDQAVHANDINKEP